jgi:parallel beta-helix repeat protein
MKRTNKSMVLYVVLCLFVCRAGLSGALLTNPTLISQGLLLATAMGAGNYAKVLHVAQSGGDFTTINAALAACVNPNPNNTYLISVMPGTYNESVNCSSFVRLQGAGKHVCSITGSVVAAHNCTIDGFHISKGIMCSGTSPTITNNIIMNDQGDGIFITQGGRPWIKENEIVDCNAWGIHGDGFETYGWIIANNIKGNGAGGIKCHCSHPTISNNQILENHHFGIYVKGELETPSEPTIDDNVIGQTDPSTEGIGIYTAGFAEPRIIANDIWVNDIGIAILDYTQPSILANNINYNHTGIRCLSSGFSKPVTIKGNHIHGNGLCGIDVSMAGPVITHNDVFYNYSPGAAVSGWDIQYIGPPFPMISFNVFDYVNGSDAAGSYNVDSRGAGINL